MAELTISTIPGAESYDIESRLFVYTGTLEEDIAVIHWWDRMNDDGDLERTFMRSGQTVGGLFRILGSCHLSCMFVDDEDQVWCACWMEKFSSGHFFSLWVRADRRQSKEAREACAFVFDQATQLSPVLLMLSKQEKLFKPFLKIGCKVVGVLEKVWDGENCFLLSMTRDGFLQGKFGPKAMQEFRQRTAWIRQRAA